MDNLDLGRAKKLLASAEHLIKQGDLSGAGGLAYQAFESAIIALTKSEGKHDYPDHRKRRGQAEQLLQIPQEAVKKLWTVRNVDFYGNEKIGEAAREITKEEIEESLQEVREVLLKIEKRTEVVKANQERVKKP